MFNKLGPGFKKRLYDEDEPPEKKLVSDGDIFIKQLAEKQRNTKVNLEEQLSCESQFYKSTEEVSVTNYTSGSKSLEEFNSIVRHSNQVEELKSVGLTNEEIELYLDYQKGYFKDKHKNMNEDVLKKWLENVSTEIRESKIDVKKKSVRVDRLMSELISSAKPNSTETKLLKFALENKQQSKEKLPGPMDAITDIERQMREDLAPIDVKKIRRKARSFVRQIDKIETSPVAEPKINKSQSCFVVESKWDVKQNVEEKNPQEKKVFTCKPLNYYTIKDGEIIKINLPENKEKLTIDEIRKLPKFSNYEKGEASKVLFLKNLAHKIEEKDLEGVFYNFSGKIVSINVMTGRMKGQAFIEFTDEESAINALHQCNGTFLKNKPVIIYFGRRKTYKD